MERLLSLCLVYRDQEGAAVQHLTGCIKRLEFILTRWTLITELGVRVCVTDQLCVSQMTACL